MYRLFRHFKTGNFYILRDKAIDANTGEEMAIYSSADTGVLYVRPFKEFYDNVEHRPDNIMKQQTRFKEFDIEDVLSKVMVKNA